ncbi:MAG: hypothetical protein O3C49_10495, partial [Proteobacteria bacterium]|nr:hypothetical protein [Pseudomonadota bacterium]
GSGRLRIDNYVLFVLWITAILRIFWPHPQLVMASGSILLIYVVLSFRRIRLQLQILSLLLTLSALALAAWLDTWAALWQGMEKAVIFSAFFGTLTLMRATADLRPEIGRARKLVEPLSAGARISGLLVGTNVLGTALIVGVMPIFAPIIGHDAPYEVRKSAAEACQRGMCLACLWSPFWLAMAISAEHLPDVPLWQIMALGLSLCALGLAVAQWMYTPDVGMKALWQALRAFSPVLPPVALAAAAVLGLNAVTPLTTLQCLVVGIPVLCICGLLAQSIDHLRVAVRQAGRSVGAVRGEIALLTCAFALGKVLEQALQAGGIGDQITSMAPPPYAVIATVVIGMTVLGLAGIHQVVTATVMLVLFGTLPIGVSDLALMQAGLLGWAFSSMTGLSAVSVAAASTMFNVPLERVAYGPNIRFVVVFGLLGIAVVTAVNWIMMP